MLLKPWCAAAARCRHGRPGYVRAPCPDSVAAISSRDHTGTGGHSRGLSARLARCSKCLPKPDRRLAAGGLPMWPCLSVDCCRISTLRTRSSVTHDSYVEAPAADDRRCSAHSSGGARLYAGVRLSEIVHQEVSSRRQSVGAMARRLRSLSCIVLAGRYSSRNRMASSRRVSVGHAFAGDAHFGGPVVFSGRALVLVACHALAPECGEVASVVDSSVPLPCYPAL